MASAIPTDEREKTERQICFAYGRDTERSGDLKYKQ